MQLVASGKPAAVVPVEYQKTKMTLYKGEDALAARREVASKLTHRMLVTVVLYSARMTCPAACQ